MRQTDFYFTACDPKTLTVGQLMQDAVTTCTPRTDGSTLASLMTRRNFGSLPIVESDGTLVGIVTEYDLLQAMIEGRDLRKILATEIMSAHPVSVTEDQTLAQVAELFRICISHGSQWFEIRSWLAYLLGATCCSAI